MNMYKALTIAGSDTSGGAGMQADLKTFQERGVYGMTALTVIVAQDPHNNWFHNVFPIAIETLEAQLETVLAGIGVDALKTGMLGSIDIIEMAASKIEKYAIKNVVVDPVMVCKGADEALHPETNECLRDVLVPKALVVTPNLFEAWQLSGVGPIKTVEQMKEAAAKIHEKGAKYVIVKGGGKLEHESAVDVLYDGKTFEILESDRIGTTYTHGAGCTYSAAITAELAKGKSPREAIEVAKAFITEAIRHSFPLNKYVGPTNHAGYRLFGPGKNENLQEQVVATK
ncbi:MULTISPECIES: pyridoxine/pyridoxal/pyridoxamine kinase [Aneurinibacillus]|uniref:pyridoxal kinase n=1 Tax=Aneurinibacillus thermoaerophilus TaxID=143495 RepID=A0A1G8AJD5_ANETH|nr:MULTISPECIES: pyridoxine/pyridoxal/pyridoxamine kinase [Aneurinibacillus]MED0675314.1 pyridoxine/pyridoxal/pyridoxamine kinase [Aneurinibacillus thermoaerophilus]MED0678606.1 pyridoxine/pyridoxal/pyridoxamine kinase [Aneurinibacillus thermoaerophilus]MED0738305.1 pyridoxine/pyridoxal/pyridoxamine kinase [Aneurinibacillus thermoaerophilus]MED0756560.1 pyridoxine/pyridoxal/pyridoxamine kinase [Aneurinibacillus thermoaerophilus]MED0760529.1 pyridoxine/pyridoxal/pyridoxamine kinase [Aneurinibac